MTKANTSVLLGQKPEQKKQQPTEHQPTPRFISARRLDEQKCFLLNGKVPDESQ